MESAESTFVLASWEWCWQTQALFSCQVVLLVACFPTWNYPHLSSPLPQSPTYPGGLVQTHLLPQSLPQQPEQ